MMQAIVEALREVDNFYKNCQLLFVDLKASVEKKTIQDPFILLTDDNWCGLNTNSSGYRRHFIANHDGRYRFAMMLMKVQEEQLRRGQAGYKTICQQLNIDAVFPLLLVTGIFEPRDIQRFRNDNNLRRNWVCNTLSLSEWGMLPDSIYLPSPGPYYFSRKITIMSQLGSDSFWCEKALFEIRRLVDIKDSETIEGVVDNMLALTCDNGKEEF
jgi:hypothetical protein